MCTGIAFQKKLEKIEKKGNRGSGIVCLCGSKENVSFVKSVISDFGHSFAQILVSDENVDLMWIQKRVDGIALLNAIQNGCID